MNWELFIALAFVCWLTSMMTYLMIAKHFILLERQIKKLQDTLDRRKGGDV
jgi:hypothetical protein